MLADILREICTFIEIPKFDPLVDDEKASKWCEDVEKLAEMFQWSEFEQLAWATGEGRAESVVFSLATGDENLGKF